jgi:hypothetical protein
LSDIEVRFEHDDLRQGSSQLLFNPNPMSGHRPPQQVWSGRELSNTEIGHGLSCLLLVKKIRALELGLLMGHEQDKRAHFKIAVTSKRCGVHKSGLISTEDPIRTMNVTEDVQLWPDS